MLELCNVSKWFPGKGHMDPRVEMMRVQLMGNPNSFKELCHSVHLSISRTRHLFREETGMPKAASGGIPVIDSATLSESAEMVAVGLAPTAVGTSEPSAT